MNSDLLPSTADRARIAFLLGIPRSGTTVLSLLLNQHSEILCPPEPWLALALDSLGQAPAAHPADAALLAKATGDFLGEDRAGILAGMAHAACRRKLEAAGKSLLVDKTPRYYQCLDGLAEAFPDSPLIWLVRNPLDVAASYLSSWGIDLAAIIEARADSPFFADYVYGLRRLADFGEGREVHTVRYEDLLTGLNPEMEKITRHLRVAPFEFSENLDPAAAGHGGEALGDRKILEAPRLHRHSVGGYAKVLSRGQIAVLLGALGPELWTRLGYGEEYARALDEIGGGVEDRSSGLYAAADDWLRHRRERCRDSCGEANAAAARIQQLEAENRDLAERLRALESDRTGAGLRKVARHLKNREFGAVLKIAVHFVLGRGRQFIAEAIWRIATGGPPRPLPRITLVTPVRNGAAHIEETLRSVLSQDYPDLEYLIVDGASTDETLAIVERYREAEGFPQRIAKVISEPDQGMYDALAKGFALASGEILGYLNADDVLEAGRLRSVGQHFAGHPRDAVIYHDDIVLIDGWKFANTGQPEGVGAGELLAGHILFQDGVFFRRKAYEAVGGVRRDFRLAGDFDLWLRLSARFPFVRRPGQVSGFRMRPGQLSTDMPAYRQEMERAIQSFRASTPAWRRGVWTLAGRVRALRRKLRGRGAQPRLHFPVSLARLPPPPAELPAWRGEPPLSPVDGQPAERLLFSAPGGDGSLCHVYLDERHGIAVRHPPLAGDSGRNPGEPAPAADPERPWPYRYYFGAPAWQRRLLGLPVERWLKPETDSALDCLLKVLRPLGFKGSDSLRVLDVGCGRGEFLEEIGRRTAWRVFGLEPDPAAGALAREKGHTVWSGDIGEALDAIPAERQFDLIHLGQGLECAPNPVQALRLLRLLLAPGGALVLGTPNLDSAQLDWFGPSWAHWNPARHRQVFSLRGLKAVAAEAGLRVAAHRTFSHGSWTARSLLANGVSPGAPPEKLREFAPRLALWSRLLWDKRGRGDELYGVLRDCDD